MLELVGEGGRRLCPVQDYRFRPDAARALTFASLVVAFIVIILANRSSEHTIVGGLALRNAALWWVVGGTTTALGLVLLLPPAQRLFHFAPVQAGDLTLSLGAGLLSVAWFDLLKLGRRWARARRTGKP